MTATSRGGQHVRNLRKSRDRRGRGIRGMLYPPTLPAARSRSERFDAVVLEAMEPLEVRWHAQLEELDVAVDEVPDVAENSGAATWQSATDNLIQDGVLHDGAVPLARLVPAGVDRRGLPTRARVVLYRRPLEARARDSTDLADLVHDVLVEQLSAYLRVAPERIEGGDGRDEDDGSE